jgi:elongation factor P
MATLQATRMKKGMLIKMDQDLFRVLDVQHVTPGIKGATASNQIKPATTETGLVVNVPPFVNPGDMIRVSTETGEYLARA